MPCAGWNGWQTLKYAANKSTPPGYSSGKEYIVHLFERANRMGMKVFRFFLTGDDSGVALLNGPGSPNEEGFQALDYIISEASKVGIKVNLAFTSPWKMSGVPQFERWCGTGGASSSTDLERIQRPYDWLTNPTCQEQFKQFISIVTERKNSITGIVYNEDPTIFSWNLANELRCARCGPEVIANWYHMMAEHTKAQDPRHLVSTGAEGFHDASSPYAYKNPDANLWGSYTGQDFVLMNDHPAIDYSTGHMWLDNWAVGTGFEKDWIQTHAQLAKGINKIYVMEEFGKEATPWEIESVRDPLFSSVYALLDSSIATGEAFKAAMIWQWDGFQRPNEAGNWLDENDSTFKNIIIPFAQRVQSMEGSPVAGCGGAGGIHSGEHVVAFGGRKLMSNE